MNDNSENKKGRFSKEEIRFVKQNILKIGVNKVAYHLNRTPDAVREHAANMGIDLLPDDVDEILPPVIGSTPAELKLISIFKRTLDYQKVQKEFSEEEMKYFLYWYGQYMHQFGSDIKASEQHQIMMLIKYEILQSRTLQISKTAQDNINRLENEIAALYGKYRGQIIPDEMRERMIDIEKTLIAMRAAEQTRTKDLSTITDKVSALQRDLKATRDQRLKNLEQSTESFIGLIKKINESSSYGIEEGEELEIMKAAAKKEKIKLASYHEYNDQSIDRPLLTPDTVFYDQDEIEEL